MEERIKRRIFEATRKMRSVHIHSEAGRPIR
jgi:hypothetical protein